MKTYMAKPADIERKWFVVDATNVPLGRVASQVADILTGKNKPIFTPHVDCGDYVIVLNSDKVVLTGKKLTDKKMRWHTGYVGGLKEVDYGTLMRKNSVKAVEKAIKGMLPKQALEENNSQDFMFTKMVSITTKRKNLKQSKLKERETNGREENKEC